jgi:hypothetical protein
MALNKKEEAERLRIQLEIGDAIERQTKSLSSWRDAQKDLVRNAKLLKSLSADIVALKEQDNELEREGISIDDERRKSIRTNIADLEKQEAQLKSINKELSNSKNLLKAAGNSAVSAFKSILPSLNEVVSKVLELDDITRKTAASIGMSGNAFQTLKNTTEEARQSAIRWNQPLDYAVKAVASYNEETGRAVQLNTQQLDLIGQVALQTNMAAEEVGTLVGQMDAFGLGAGQATQMIADMQSMSESMGVNSGKVIKKFQQNLGMLNKLNFRGGTKALAQMAAHSEKFKLSMEAVAGVADKVFRPEGAIEASARLQTMGGAMAQLGDPFQLMYQARNAPEELAKSITKAARESAIFNKQTGEFEMSAHELDRLRESADALGMDYQELVQTAKQAAKVDFLSKFLGDIPEDQRGIFEGMSQMTQRGAEITFYDPDLGVQTKLLSELNAKDKKNIMDRAKSDKDRADQAKSLAGEWQSIQNGLMLIAVEALQPFLNELSGGNPFITELKKGLIAFAEGVREFIKDGGLSKYMDEIVLGLKIGVATFIGVWIASQVAAGMQFGLGFRMSSGIGKVGGAGGAGRGGAGGLNAAQTLASGKSSMAMGKGSMMKSFGSAAQILAVGAALMMMAKALDIFADAMIKLKEVPVGLLVGVGAGLLVFVGALGALGASGIGEIGVAIMLAIGAALLLMGAAVWLVASGMSILVDSFTNMFKVVNKDNIIPIMLLGPALTLAGIGMMALAASLVVMGMALSNPFGLIGLVGLTAAAVALNQAFGDVDAGGITEAVNSVNSVNKENIDALKSLSSWLAVAGNNIKIEFGEIHVDGEIGLSGSGGVTANSELLNDPIFMRELKRVIAEHTHFDTNGGR